MASGTSYNGWPAHSDPDAIAVVQSEWFPGGVKAGDVTTVLRYVVEQFHARVEPVVGGWCWGYNYRANVNNPSSLSCHASGTALDINAPEHPNGSGGTFTSAQRGQILAILDEVQGAVDWLEGYDEMHFEIAVDAATLARIAATLPAGQPDLPPDNGVTMFLYLRNPNRPEEIWAFDGMFKRYVKSMEEVDVVKFAAGAQGVQRVGEGSMGATDVSVAAWASIPIAPGTEWNP